MAFASRFPAVLAGVLSFLGGIPVSAQDPAVGSNPPSVLVPADRSSNQGGGVVQGFPGVLNGGGTVSLLGYVLTIVVLGAAGLTVLLRGGFLGVSWGGTKAARKLRIEESRVVGSRQHLAVVEYEGRRVLLGISPGRIDYLCALEGDGIGPVGFTEALSDASKVALPRGEGEGKEEVSKRDA
jgi:flagellar biogenesis protein FliO